MQLLKVIQIKYKYATAIDYFTKHGHILGEASFYVIEHHKHVLKNISSGDNAEISSSLLLIFSPYTISAIFL